MEGENVCVAGGRAGAKFAVKATARLGGVNEEGTMYPAPARALLRGAGKDDFERKHDVSVLDVFLEAGDDVEADVFAFCEWKLREERLEGCGDFRELRPKFFDRTGPARGDGKMIFLN